MKRGIPQQFLPSSLFLLEYTLVYGDHSIEGDTLQPPAMKKRINDQFCITWDYANHNTKYVVVGLLDRIHFHLLSSSSFIIPSIL